MRRLIPYLTTLAVIAVILLILYVASIFTGGRPPGASKVQVNFLPLAYWGVQTQHHQRIAMGKGGRPVPQPAPGYMLRLGFVQIDTF